MMITKDLVFAPTGTVCRKLATGGKSRVSPVRLERLLQILPDSATWRCDIAKPPLLGPSEGTRFGVPRIPVLGIGLTVSGSY